MPCTRCQIAGYEWIGAAGVPDEGQRRNSGDPDDRFRRHSHDPRDPFSLIEPPVDFTAATRRSIRGLKIAYSPNLDVFPVDGKVAETVGRALRAFEEAGAQVEEVKLGITRSQRELSDVWSRLYMVVR